MNDAQPLDRQAAGTYAAWFKALAGGTRVQVVSLLARSGEPLTVKQIAAAVPVGQSTVSEHLRQLPRWGSCSPRSGARPACTGSTETAWTAFPPPRTW